MPRPILLRGGRVLDPSRNVDEPGDILIVDGKIENASGRVGSPDSVDVIDCEGLIISPGFIDVHCHLRKPGREDVETIASGARAAAAIL